MTDALLADLRALAEKWKRPGLTCEPWDDVTDDLRDLIAKHAPEPDVSERDELARVLAGHTYVAGSDGRGCLCGWRREHGDGRPLQEQHADHLPDAILAAGWRKR